MANTRIKGCIIAKRHEFQKLEEEPHYMFLDGKMSKAYSDMGWVFVHDYTIEVVPMDADEFTRKQIEALRAEQNKVRAEMVAKINSINEQIMRLSALDYSPEAA